MKRVDIGLLGCGTVGRGLVQLLDRERVGVRNRYGIDLSITRIAVRDLNAAPGEGGAVEGGAAGGWRRSTENPRI